MSTQPGKDLNLTVGPFVFPSRAAAMEEQAVRLGPQGVQQLRAAGWRPPMMGGSTPLWYANGLKYCLQAGGTPGIDLVADTIKLMLVTTSYVPNQQTDDYANDFSANEATGGSGYPAGGFTLGSKALTVSTLTASWDAADITQAITGGPFTFRYGCFYRYITATMTTNPVIGYVDFQTQTLTGATLSITLANQLQLVAS